jgi:hypothetical protein
MSDKFEIGYELYRQEPDLLLIEVYHRAPISWPDADREAFVMGYIAMRRKRDAYANEVQHEQERDG